VVRQFAAQPEAVRRDDEDGGIGPSADALTTAEWQFSIRGVAAVSSYRPCPQAHPTICAVIGGLPVAVSAREEDPELVRRHGAPFRFLSIFRKESARNCASADELGHGAGDGFGLLPSHRQ
jgi:hypothetical protein